MTFPTFADWNVQSFFPSSLQQLRDLIPFFMCLEGDFSSALIGFLPTVNAPASRFTPQLFLIYFYIFKTATAPHCIIASHPFHLCRSDAVWEPIKGPWVYSLCFFKIQMQILCLRWNSLQVLSLWSVNCWWSLPSRFTDAALLSTLM